MSWSVGKSASASAGSPAVRPAAAPPVKPATAASPTVRSPKAGAPPVKPANGPKDTLVALALDPRSALQMARDDCDGTDRAWHSLTAEQKKEEIAKRQQAIDLARTEVAKRICIESTGQASWDKMSSLEHQSALREAATQIEARRRSAAEAIRQAAEAAEKEREREDSMPVSEAAKTMCIKEIGQEVWDQMDSYYQQAALRVATEQVEERRRQAAEDEGKLVSPKPAQLSRPVSSGAANRNQKKKIPAKKAGAKKPATQSTAAQKKLKRDPRKPKAPMSAYLFYCVDGRLSTTESHPNLAPHERTKLMGELWKQMSEAEKQPYARKAAVDKARHAREMAEFNTPAAQTMRRQEDAAAAEEAKQSKKPAKKQKTKKGQKRSQKPSAKPKKRKAPPKPKGPPPSAGERRAVPSEGAHDETMDESHGIEMVGVDGERWASQFRRKWSTETDGWSVRPQQGHNQAARKTKWPLQTAVDNKRWGEDFVLQFWYRRLKVSELGPWQKTGTTKGFSASSEEEAKTSEVRNALIKSKLDSMEQMPSWLLEQQVENENGQPAESVKLTLPACGCPPSHSRTSKRKRSALRDYLFDIRPRAPPPKSKAEKRLEQQNKRKRLEIGEDVNRSSKAAAEAAIVQPSEDPETEILAKEDWDNARRHKEGVGVDAQIRVLLGVLSRRVELEHHQERRWLQTDQEVDKSGRNSHTNHTVPRAIRMTLQDMVTSIGGVDAEARSLKRSMKSALKTTQHSGYSSNDGRVKSRSLLEIYRSLRNRRLCEYRKADDAADQGYLRKRRQDWDGLQNSKGLKWRGGDHMLVVLPRHSETATLAINDLAKIEFALPTVAQVSAGLEDFATPNAPGMKAILGKEFGLAAATCTHVRNGVLSVEFLDGDVLGGIPAEYGGLIHVASADFEALQEKYLADQLATETQELQRTAEEPQARKHKQARGDVDKSFDPGASFLPASLSRLIGSDSLGPMAQVAAVVSDLSARVADTNGSDGDDSDSGAEESDGGVDDDDDDDDDDGNDDDGDDDDGDDDGVTQGAASRGPEEAHDIEIEADVDGDDDDDDDDDTTASVAEQAHDSGSDADDDEDGDDDGDDNDEAETTASADPEEAQDIESDADEAEDGVDNDSGDEAEEIDTSTSDVATSADIDSPLSQADNSVICTSSDSGSDDDDVGTNDGNDEANEAQVD